MNSQYGSNDDAASVQFDNPKKKRLQYIYFFPYHSYPTILIFFSLPSPKKMTKRVLITKRNPLTKCEKSYSKKIIVFRVHQNHLSRCESFYSKITEAGILFNSYRTDDINKIPKNNNYSFVMFGGSKLNFFRYKLI